MAWFIQNEQQAAAIKEIEESKSDRIVAIVGVAVLDEQLRLALEWRLLHDTKIVERLFKPDGPLGGFKAKINLGYLLYMYDRKTRNALSAMDSVRNCFAHRLEMTFASKDADLRKGFKDIVLHENRTHYPHPMYDGDSETPLEEPTNNRDRFLLNVKIATLLFMRDNYRHHPWTNDYQPLSKEPPKVYEPPAS